MHLKLVGFRGSFQGTPERLDTSIRLKRWEISQPHSWISALGPQARHGNKARRSQTSETKKTAEINQPPLYHFPRGQSVETSYKVGPKIQFISGNTGEINPRETVKPIDFAAIYRVPHVSVSARGPLCLATGSLNSPLFENHKSTTCWWMWKIMTVEGRDRQLDTYTYTSEN